jgi:hypothetical protein
MKRTILGGLLLACAGTASLHAQTRVYLAGGVTFPQGSFGDRAYAGWHGLATLNLSSPTQVYGLRFDVDYNRFGTSTETPVSPAAYGGARFTTTSGTLNLTYRLPMTNSAFSPYVITGLGVYVTDCSGAAGCGSSAHYGWNIGAGTKFYLFGLQGFLEGRFNRTGFRGAPVHYFPITLGLTL